LGGTVSDLPEADTFLVTSALTASVLVALALTASGLTAPFADELEPLVAAPEGRFSSEFLGFLVSACLSGLPGLTDLTGNFGDLVGVVSGFAVDFGLDFAAAGVTVDFFGAGAATFATGFEPVFELLLPGSLIQDSSPDF
jgi:hypothetical protein